jgi:peptidoglycan/LPS O-acetylase OafA/YrhL
MSAPNTKDSMRLIRADIQALRTIAVLLVVLFHYWPTRVPGGFIGVDVFFVISGFLITEHIKNEVAGQKFSVTDFWARRIKRLIPASFLVLLSTGVAIILLVPVSNWSQWLGELQAAVLYFENWKLAWASVDYLALANQASPVQHFWSLSTEEQFYFGWPLLIALAVLLTHLGRKKSPKTNKSVFVALLSVTAISLIFGIYLTTVEPAISYFSTPVRAWEFGVGALATFVPAILASRSKSLIATLGLLGIIASAFVINTNTPFPGTAALLPVFGTFAVIIAHVETGNLASLLNLRPLQWVGDKSYAIYLWHWPILVIAPFVIHTELSPGNKVGLLALTAVLAWLTSEYVESPISQIRPPKWRVFGLTAVASALIISVSVIGIQLGTLQIEAALKFGKSGAVAEEPCFGAAARAPGRARCENSNLTQNYPSLSVAASDIPVLPESCFSVTREQIAASYCALGDRLGSVKVAAIGDSHIAQYAGALNVLAMKNHWQLDLYAKGGCPFSFAIRVHDAILTKNCPAWVANVVAATQNKKYAAIVTSQRAGVPWQGGETSAVSGLTKLWDGLTSSGNNLVAIKDSPFPGRDMVQCLQAKKDCTFSRATGLKFDPQVASASSNKKITLLDFDNVFCDPNKCFSLIGNTIVFRDDNHLTDTFARTMAPFIEPALLRAIQEK